MRNEKIYQGEKAFGTFKEFQFVIDHRVTDNNAADYHMLKGSVGEDSVLDLEWMVLTFGGPWKVEAKLKRVVPQAIQESNE